MSTLSFTVRKAANGYVVVIDDQEHVATSQKDIGELIRGLLRGKFTDAPKTEAPS